MNRINQKLKEDKKLLSIYFTAGYPSLEDTSKIIQNLEKKKQELDDNDMVVEHINWALEQQSC